MRLARSLLILLAVFFAWPINARMMMEPVTWTLNGTNFKGALVYDDTVKEKRPGLVMVPNWMGVTDLAVEKAKGVAGKDYVILLVDMYGEDLRPADTTEAMAAVKPLYGDRNLMRARIGKAYEVLKQQAQRAPIDAARLGAIGFCFGGSAVLDLARSGADAGAVVSFHGGLTTDDPALAKNIKARVLVINGADDTSTRASVPQFVEEMQQSTADWMFVDIGHAVHCFTETEATAPTGNCRYDEKAARRSYRMMHDWLDESFGAN